MGLRTVYVSMMVVFISTQNNNVEAAVGYGDDCTSPNGNACDTVEHSLCLDELLTSSCNCALNTYLVDMIPYRCTKVLLSDACGEAISNAECDKIPHAGCPVSTCICDTGYFGYDKTTTCNPVQVTTSCGTNADVCNSIEHGACSSEVQPVCTCATGTTPINTAPYKCTAITLSETCNVGSEATECAKIQNAHCVGGYCQCDTGFYGIDGAVKCFEVKLYFNCGEPFGQACGVIDNAECKPVGTCQCKAGFYGTDPKKCTEVLLGFDCANPNENPCDEIANAKCVSDKCTCDTNFFGRDGGKTCTSEATVRCSKHSPETMMMEIRAEKNVAHQEIATFNSELKMSGCKQSTIATDGNFFELMIEINIASREQVDKATKDCFVENDGDKKVNVLVVGKADAVYIQGTDRFYKAECDVDNLIGQTITLRNVGFNSVIQPTDKVTETDDVTLTLVKAADDSDLDPTAVSLTEEVKLKVTLNRKKLATAPLGVYLQNLYVSGEPGFELKMIGSYGCVEDVAAFKVATTFKPVDTTITVDTADKFETLTGKFNLALFDGMAELKLFFSVEYSASCYVNTDASCFDLQKYCEDNKRRRRRSNTPVTNGTVTLGVNVNLNGHNSANHGGTDDNLKTPEKCTTSRDFWIIAAVLGCLGLAALLFAMYLFRRLKREQKRADKLEMFGTRNPAF